MKAEAPNLAAVHQRRIWLALAWYSVAFHRGIARYAHEARWIVDGGFVREGFIPAQWDGDGVIAVMGMHRDLDELLLRLQVPIVNIGYDRFPGIPSVAADSVAIGRMAGEHFLSRGFRNFAFYECSRRPGEQQRRDGLDAVLRERGHKLHLIGPFSSTENQPQGRMDRFQLLGHQLREIPKPVAVFVEYDDRGVDVIDAAIGAGLSVPEQVAVLGCDNDELRCPFAPVPLSSIDNDEQRVGYEAARMLNLLMEGKGVPEDPLLIPPRAVVVRQSTNILAIPHEHVATALRMIWENYTKPIDATRVAAEIPLSYPQLHASFVRHVGHSMAEELTQRRIEHAQRLLSNADIKLAEVARLSGFGSGDRMGRVFFRKLGITPSDYRKQVQEHRSPGEKSEELAKPALLDAATRAAKR